MISMGNQIWYETHRVRSQPHFIVVYLSHTCSSSAPIITAISAIPWAHRIAGANDPTQMPLVKYTSKGLKRSLAKPIGKKRANYPSHLERYCRYAIKTIFRNHSSRSSSLRTVAMCLPAYTGFLRFIELVSIQSSHITFNQQGLTLFIPSSKTGISWGKVCCHQ